MSYDLTLIYQYLYNKQIWANNDVVQLGNNVSFRNSDPLDHLEMIMAQTRKATIEEVARDLYPLLRMVRRK